MSKSWKGLAAAAAILTVPAGVRAHAFRCEKTVNGLPVGTPAHVYAYPATLTYDWTVFNTHPTETSIIQGLTDSLFGTAPLEVPYPIPLGGSVSVQQELTIDGYPQCVELASGVPGGEITLTNELTVFFDGAPQAWCSAQVICHPPEEDQCLTRTPGYWGTHPDVTARLLPVESCGVQLGTTIPGVLTSITEDLCSVGKDHKLYDSPQEAQLVRQCAAAALNMAASAELGGSCSAFLDGFAACCTSCGDPVPGCIDALDAFNNSPDTLLVDGGEISLCHDLGLSCAAKPAACQTAGGNTFVIDR